MKHTTGSDRVPGLHSLPPESMSLSLAQVNHPKRALWWGRYWWSEQEEGPDFAQTFAQIKTLEVCLCLSAYSVPHLGMATGVGGMLCTDHRCQVPTLLGFLCCRGLPAPKHPSG